MLYLLNYILCISTLLSAVLAQWGEELGKLMLLRHQNRKMNSTASANMDPSRSQSQNAAFEIAKAAALYAANQHMQRPYG